ncbi:hypothetical protein GCM10011583_03920 [Streptomyces camponoticapitis]|uniref:Uncharacterized protein n=1 Tax=Streptomyces camponoticapitis TaxID=1616125 RepID=A0ABQ2DXN5_9ACTN|nr:hypothetical protein GCM10011583_03920 [Streptomyces camponoticapitis]
MVGQLADGRGDIDHGSEPVGLERLVGRGSEGQHREGDGHYERHGDQQDKATIDFHCAAPSPEPVLSIGDTQIPINGLGGVGGDRE